MCFHRKIECRIFFFSFSLLSRFCPAFNASIGHSPFCGPAQPLAFLTCSTFSAVPMTRTTPNRRLLLRGASRKNRRCEVSRFFLLLRLLGSRRRSWSSSPPAFFVLFPPRIPLHSRVPFLSLPFRQTSSEFRTVPASFFLLHSFVHVFPFSTCRRSMLDSVTFPQFSFSRSPLTPNFKGPSFFPCVFTLLPSMYPTSDYFRLSSYGIFLPHS